MEKRLLRALKRKKTDRPPFWFMRQAGRYLPEYRELRKRAGSFLELCYTPELAAEVTLQPLRRFGMDAAILFSDILVVPHALGQELSFIEGEGPKLGELKLENLSLSRAEPHIQPVLETVRRVSAELPRDAALIGFAGAPWTVACYMIEGGGSREFEKARSFAAREPERFAALMELITRATILYLDAQVKAGAEAVQLFDSWAGVLSEADFTRFSIAPTNAIVAALKAGYPHLPIIGFPRLAGAKAARYAKETGVDAVSLDYTLPLGWAKKEIAPHAVLQGNLDPVLLKEDIGASLAQTKAIRAAWGDSFVFNLGHGMLPGTPVEHVEALSEYLNNVIT